MFTGRKFGASVLATAMLAASVFVPAAAPQPVVTGGLVNVTIVDFIDVNNNEVEILNDVNVAAALQLAANVCDVNVNVLAQQFRQGGDAACTNTQTLDQALID